VTRYRDLVVHWWIAWSSSLLLNMLKIIGAATVGIMLQSNIFL